MTMRPAPGGEQRQVLVWKHADLGTPGTQLPGVRPRLRQSLACRPRVCLRDALAGPGPQSSVPFSTLPPFPHGALGRSLDVGRKGLQPTIATSGAETSSQDVCEPRKT